MTYVGILTKPAAVAVAVIISMSGLLVVGWKAKTAFEAQAAQPSGVEQKLDKLDERTQAMAIDIATIKAKLEGLEKRR